MFYSFIVPTFNRPDEVLELLDSLAGLDVTETSQFEVIIADGSPTEILKPVVQKFSNRLSLRHIQSPLLAISPSRNLGALNAKGEYLIFLDSDVILPADYLNHVEKFLSTEKADGFGGPDKAHESFTPIQKAISYAMTSFLTTGGIRGNKKHLHRYNPRGFNMGIRKKVFEEMNGFSSLTCGEDIELSIRIINAGHSVKLIPEAYVYHKRRTTFKSFFRQVFRFGAARINIFNRYRNELKTTHLLPSFFVFFLVGGILTGFFSALSFRIFISILGLYFLVIFSQSTVQNKSVGVGFLSIISSVLQLTGYGCGLIANAFTVFVRGKREGISLGPSK